MSVSMLTDTRGTAFLPLKSTFTPDGFPSTILTGWRSVQYIVLPAYTMPLNSVAPEAAMTWTQQSRTAVSLMCRRRGAWRTAAGEVETFGLDAVDGFCTCASCFAAVGECEAKCW